MKSSLNRRNFITLSGLALAGTLKAEMGIPDPAYPPVTLPGTQVRSIKSQIVDHMNYRIFIALPDEYHTGSESFPVLYFLDAWAQFGIIKQAYWLLRFFNEVTPLVIVGIAFEGDAEDLIYNRARDYTPTHVPEERLGDALSFTPISGGASKFVQFLNHELFPFVEEEYRVDPSDRGIFGVSFGGLLGTYILFHHTEMFQRYLLGSSSWWWDNNISFTYEEDYSKTHKSLPAKVFMTTGSEEGEERVKEWKRFRDQVISRNYEGLELASFVFEGETHMSSVPATHSRALRVLYGT